MEVFAIIPENIYEGDPMKKFFLYLALALAVLGAIFAYVLYTEGFFDSAKPAGETELKPFPVMKCEAGKCASGKCEAN